jgi:hypothetical protein
MGATAGVREQLMLTRWKQPCVIWEASKLTHLVRLAEPVFRPSRYQNCGGIVRSPHALARPIAKQRRKRKLFVHLRNNRSRMRAKDA